MSDTITYYFDFSSSYSYLAHARLDEISDATGKTINQRPIVLGAIFHQLDHIVPSPNTSKMNYFNLDLPRCAAELGIKFGLPKPFPFNAMLAMRVYYHLESHNAAQAKRFSAAIFNAAYAEQIDVSNSENISTLLADLDISLESVLQDAEFEQAKATLKRHTQAAIEAGVFGAPSFLYKDELFWGTDRVDMLIRRASQ